MKKLKISKESFVNAENLSLGIYSPLKGFLDEKNFSSCLQRGRLADNTPWTIPIVLDVGKNQIQRGQKIFLTNGKGRAVFYPREIFPYSKRDFAQRVFGTTDRTHPGVEKVYTKKDYLAAGPVTILEASRDPYKKFSVTPKQTKEFFKRLGWKTIAAFQTRNVPHIGHEYLQKKALTICDGLFINPVIGKKKSGDFKDALILKTYRALIKNYFQEDHVLLGSFNYEMHYAGPREAIHHAIIRRNFGCTHFIVGRDHAGVGNFYHPYAAQKIFKKYPDLGITPIFSPALFHCKKCNNVSSPETCAHTGAKTKIEFKGTALRNMIRKGKLPPAHLMRPQIVEIISKYPNPFV
jgi:sulfate adenylyltransferase